MLTSSDGAAFTSTTSRPYFEIVSPKQRSSGPLTRGPAWNGRSRAPSIRVFQSSIGIDSGTQLPASNFDEAISSAGQLDDEEIFSLAPPLESVFVATVEPQQLLATATTATTTATTSLPDSTASIVAVLEGDTAKKILNGLLLAATFGFAAYTILNIDAGMTRGWTQSEIAMRIPLDNWLNYESSLADRPIFTKTAINVIIYLLGDWLSQTIFAKKDILDFDAVRTLRNGFIGLCFGPLVVQYYQFSDHILPVEGGMWNRLEKILMDQTVYLTVKCSIYIAAVGLLSGDDPDTVKTNVQTKLPKIVVTAWKFWPLVHLVTYGVIPARHRILWVNCVDLVWNAILAGMTSKTKEVEDQPDVVVVAEDMALLAGGQESGIAGSVLASEPLQVQQSDASIAHTNLKDEDPFLLHQDVISYDMHSESLFDAQNSTAAETIASN